MLTAVGIDVGGTKIAGGLVSLGDGEVLEKRLLPTLPARGGDAVLDDVIAMASELVGIAQRHHWQMTGVGVGVPELVDTHGNVISHQTLPWNQLDVQALLNKRWPATVESDVRAAALAEALYGAGRAFRQFVYVTVGTGISHTLVIDGVPYAGSRGNALVFASAPVTVDCPHCGQRIRPVLEEYASGPAIVRRYNETGGATVQSGEAVMHAAAGGDLTAVAVVGSAGEALGVAVAWLVNVLDPEAVIMGGGLGLAGGIYWERCRTALYEHIWAENTRSTLLLPAQLHIDAGLIGAAAAHHRRMEKSSSI